jgi:hypothetical protein
MNLMSILPGKDTVSAPRLERSKTMLWKSHHDCLGGTFWHQNRFTKIVPANHMTSNLWLYELWKLSCTCLYQLTWQELRLFETIDGTGIGPCLAVHGAAGFWSQESNRCLLEFCSQLSPKQLA